MEPIRIEIENFMCFEKETFDFDERLYFVLGKNLTNLDISNGCGKSAFVEAIKFGLGGKPRKTIPETIRIGQDSMKVVLHFLHEGQKFISERGIKKNKSFFKIFQIEKNKKTPIAGSTSESAAWLNNLLQKDSINFLDLIFVDAKLLISKKAAERVSFLEGLFVGKTFEKCTSIINQTLRDISFQLGELGILKREKEEIEKKTKELKVSLKEKTTSLKRLTKDLEKSKKEVKKSEKKLEQYNKALSQAAKKKELAQFLAKNQKLLERYEEELYQATQLKEEYEKKFRLTKESLPKQDLESLNTKKQKAYAMRRSIESLKLEALNKKAKIEAKQEMLNAQITQISEVSGKCPTCKQTINDAFKKNFINNKKKELDKVAVLKVKAEKALNKIVKQIETLDEKIVKIDNVSIKISSTESKLEKYTSLIASNEKVINNLQEVVNDLNHRVNKSKDEYNSIEDVTIDESIILETRQLKSKLEELTKKFYQTETIVQETENNLKVFSKKLIELNMKVNELNEIEKKGKRYEILSKVFSKGQFRKYYYNMLINEIVNRSNDFLDPRFTILLEEGDILVEDQYGKRPVVLLSTGEKVRIGTALYLAMLDLLKGIKGFDLNLLILDEVFDSLDKNGIELMKHLLKKLSDRFLTLGITPRNDIEFEHTITILKDEVKSYIEK